MGLSHHSPEMTPEPRPLAGSTTPPLGAPAAAVTSDPAPGSLAWAQRRLTRHRGLTLLSLSARAPDAAADAIDVLVGEASPRRLSLETRGPGELSPELHATIYRLRRDVGGAVVARTPWASALAAWLSPMPGLFDEQVRQLGRRVERMEGLWALENGHCAFLWGDSALCLGVTLERAVFNLELLEKCAEAFLLAAATGRRLTRVPLWVREIAMHRLRSDQKRAERAWAKGEAPAGFTAY